MDLYSIEYEWGDKKCDGGEAGGSRKTENVR